MGLALPPKRIAVNLAPADLAKEGSHYDLPIARADGGHVLPADSFDGMVVLGELPDGSIALSMVCCQRQSVPRQKIVA